MDCSLSGSSFHGILQARVLEWVPIFFLLQGIFSTQGSNLQLLHWQVDSLPSEPPGKPQGVRLFAYKKNENSFFFYNSTNPVELSNNLVELIIFIPFYGGRNWQWEFKEIFKWQGLLLVGRWSKQEWIQSETHVWDQGMLLNGCCDSFKRCDHYITKDLLYSPVKSAHYAVIT